MKHAGVLISVHAFFFIGSLAAGDELPRQGSFTSYFFVDRWGQPVFDIFYVHPAFGEELSTKGWRPLEITTKDIYQWMNPGGAMIRQIESIDVLGEAPLHIELGISKNAVRYGDATTFRITMANRSNQPVTLHRRNFLLRITVRKRGTIPDGAVVRDETYDCFNNRYHDLASRIDFLRATNYLELFTEAGEISMRNGNPALYIHKEGQRRTAWLYDEVKTTIPSGQSATSKYTIGSGWLINEYELQAEYRLAGHKHLRYVLSKPIAFDVTWRREE